MLPSLCASAAASLDSRLLQLYPLPVLMELAGLSCAAAISAEYPAERHARVLIVCGPGNNGGDGLVCARHLSLGGYQPTVVLPRRGATRAGAVDAQLYDQLLAQLAALEVPVLGSMPDAEAGPWQLAVDALFGFSFHAEQGVREPYLTALAQLRAMAQLQAPPWEPSLKSECLAVSVGGAPATGPAVVLAVRQAPSVPAKHGGVCCHVVSIDLPSGWDCDAGDVLPPELGGGLRPSMLISLTAPKPAAAAFSGHALWLGGQFVPPGMAKEWGITPLQGMRQARRL